MIGCGVVAAVFTGGQRRWLGRRSSFVARDTIRFSTLIQRAKILTRRREADLNAAVDRLVQNVLPHFHTDHPEDAQAGQPNSSDSAHSSSPREDQGS